MITNREIIAFCIGFVVGALFVVIVTTSMISSFDGVFQGMNVSLSFNETRLVEEMNRSFMQRVGV